MTEILLTIMTMLVLLFGGALFGVTIAEIRADRKETATLYNQGYEDGFIAGAAEAAKDFPRTLDGRFYSTEAAIRSMSQEEGVK